MFAKINLYPMIQITTLYVEWSGSFYILNLSEIKIQDPNANAPHKIYGN